MLPDYSIITSVFLGVGLAVGIVVSVVSIYMIATNKLKINLFSVLQGMLIVFFGGFSIWVCLGVLVILQGEKHSDILNAEFQNKYPAACTKVKFKDIENAKPEGYMICITGKRIILHPVDGIDAQ